MKNELRSIRILFMLLLNFSGNALTAQNILTDNPATWTVLPGNVGEYGLQFDTIMGATRVHVDYTQPIVHDTVTQIVQTDSTLSFTVTICNSALGTPHFSCEMQVDSAGVLRLTIDEGWYNIGQSDYYDSVTIRIRKTAGEQSLKVRGVGFVGDSTFRVGSPTEPGK